MGAELIPNFVHYGFVKDENGKKVTAVPYITREEEKIFFDIEREAGEMFAKCCLDDAAKVCKANMQKYPKHIKNIPMYAYNLPLDYLPLLYVFEAAERNLISLQKGKNYPIMYFVTK